MGPPSQTSSSNSMQTALRLARLPSRTRRMQTRQTRLASPCVCRALTGCRGRQHGLHRRRVYRFRFRPGRGHALPGRSQRAGEVCLHVALVERFWAHNRLRECSEQALCIRSADGSACRIRTCGRLVCERGLPLSRTAARGRHGAVGVLDQLDELARRGEAQGPPARRRLLPCQSPPDPADAFQCTLCRKRTSSKTPHSSPGSRSSSTGSSRTPSSASSWR